MNYITYHEWCRHLRNASFIDRSVGKLDRLAADSGISADRLNRWLAKDLNLSHAEFIRLHEVLAETHVLGSEDDTVAKIEAKNIAEDCMQPCQCYCDICQSGNIQNSKKD